MQKMLVIDNYDSFTYNLVQMFRSFPLDISVRRNDRISLEEIELLCPDYLVISPGPGRPSDAGISMAMIKQFAPRIPILGVCLGMQCINEVFHGNTVSSLLPTHGKTMAVEHYAKDLFAGIASPMTVALYHSLMSEVTTDDLRITAKGEKEVVMGLSHKKWPLHGVQFHPESFMTPHGFKIIENYIQLGPVGKNRQPREKAVANG